VDWASSLQKNKTQLRKAQSGAFYAPQNPISQLVPPGNENKTQFRKHKVVHFMHPKTRSHNGYHPVTELRETTQKLSFGPQEVDWACSLRKKQDATSEA